MSSHFLNKYIYYYYELLFYFYLLLFVFAGKQPNKPCSIPWLFQRGSFPFPPSTDLSGGCSVPAFGYQLWERLCSFGNITNLALNRTQLSSELGSAVIPQGISPLWLQGCAGLSITWVGAKSTGIQRGAAASSPSTPGIDRKILDQILPSAVGAAWEWCELCLKSFPWLGSGAVAVGVRWITCWRATRAVRWHLLLWWENSDIFCWHLES